MSGDSSRNNADSHSVAAIPVLLKRRLNALKAFLDSGQALIELLTHLLKLLSQRFESAVDLSEGGADGSLDGWLKCRLGLRRWYNVWILLRMLSREGACLPDGDEVCRLDDVGHDECTKMYQSGCC
jgi:hypothetical protein